MVMSKNTMILALGFACFLAIAQSLPASGFLEEALSKTPRPGVGLVKATQYDWKDSNMALFGSDLEKQVKKESASTEEAWKEAGQKAGLQIWRIVDFKVVAVPKENYGKFYDGDSYIILNTHKTEGSDELLYDLFFWVGKESSQDEYGTAAYKTVELDTYLNGSAKQYRELQDFESVLFKSNFNDIEVVAGGAESGFTHVTPKEFASRLLKVHGDRYGVLVSQVPRSVESLDTADVFIMDMGLALIQWNGAHSNKDERIRAHKIMREIAEERSGKVQTAVVEEGQEDAIMRRFLRGEESKQMTPVIVVVEWLFY